MRCTMKGQFLLRFRLGRRVLHRRFRYFPIPSWRINRIAHLTLLWHTPCLRRLATWDSQRTVTPAFDRFKSGYVRPHLETGDGVSSTTRKDALANSVGTWFRLHVLFIIVAAVGLAIWPLRKLYLTLKEKFDERWDGTVL